MRSILFASIAFPPKFDSEGLQVARYFKYLKEECKGRFEIDVVTSAIPTLFMPVDNSLKAVDSGYRQKIEIKIPENKYKNFLLRKISPSLIDNPDSKHSFYQQWKKVVKQLKNRPSLIYSRSSPTSSAIMGMRLKEYYQVPWIMHISDPWSDSPVANFTGKVKEINQSFEKQCFEKADKICLTSHQTIAFYKNKYPEYSNKYEYFPNVYDADDILTETTTSDNSKLRIVYTGGIAATRSPEPFLKAIGLLPDAIKDQLEIIFSGIADRRNTAVFEKYKDPCIKYIGSLATYKEAIALQQSADILLLIDFPIKEKKYRMYFLSKLLDYMIAKKYILGITGEGSVCWDVINNKMGKCFEENDSPKLADHICYLVEQFKKDNSVFRISNISQEFDASSNAKRLVSLFESMVSQELVYQ
jgi:glycosyltransferase involved in cell wall biosynthesis